MLKPNKVQTQLNYIKCSGDRITKLRFNIYTVNINTKVMYYNHQLNLAYTLALGYWNFNTHNWD